MAFRRGFKSQCERRSAEYRKQLGLKDVDALDAKKLAKHLGVTVWSVADVQGLLDEEVKTLIDPADDSWSALTMRLGAQDLVLYKPVSSVGRTNSVIMHELAHIVLGHELAEACLLPDGSLVPGNFSQEQEDEADWFAGTLLLPRPALVSIRLNRIADDVACSRFLVSREMLVWRNRMTGVEYQFAGSRA